MFKRYVTGALSSLLLGFVLTAPTAHAFDLEDYATTFRATRDAYMKAKFELAMAAGVYSRARIVMDLMGFDMSAEAMFWPLDNYRPKIADRTGQACEHEGHCNASAMCNGGFCTAPEVRHPIVGMSRSAWRQMRSLYVKATEVGDQISASNFWMPESPWGGQDIWYRGDGQFQAGLWQEKGNANSRRIWEIQSTPMHDIAAENDPDSPFYGLVVPLLLETAAWPVDPVEDADIISDAYTQYRAVRDSTLKAVSEFELARGPYEAAVAAYVTATERYTALASCTDMSPEIPAEWFCVARSNANDPLRCACNRGPGRCTAADPGVVANEPTPSTSFRVCPLTPMTGLHCACVPDDDGRACLPGAQTRYYN